VIFDPNTSQALKPEERTGHGRISIILWGLAENCVDEEDSPAMIDNGKNFGGKGGKGRGGEGGKGRGRGRSGGGKGGRGGGGGGKGGRDRRDDRRGRGGSGGGASQDGGMPPR
jgi:hypothetical protein